MISRLSHFGTYPIPQSEQMFHMREHPFRRSAHCFLPPFRSSSVPIFRQPAFRSEGRNSEDRSHFYFTSQSNSSAFGACFPLHVSSSIPAFEHGFHKESHRILTFRMQKHAIIKLALCGATICGRHERRFVGGNNTSVISLHQRILRIEAGTPSL